MEKNVEIIIEQDHICVMHNKEEVVYWIHDEWEEDPSIVTSIANAIYLASTNIKKLRKLVGK